MARSSSALLIVRRLPLNAPFSSFLERKEYDEAESALFAMVRTAFLAGWKAAGGEPPSPQKLFELIRCGTNDPRVNKPDTPPD